MPSASFYLCLDQGGHASRAIIYDAAGNIRTEASVAITTHVDGVHVEHDAEELVRSLRAAAENALAQLGPSPSISAAGLATQRSTLACWDRVTGEALAPIISWRDTRAAAALRQGAIDAAEIKRLTGLPPSPHFGASKLRWCLDNIPAVQEATAAGRLAWGPLASFLVFRLTRERRLLADPSSAGRTLLWNLSTADWDERLLELFGLPHAPLPRCVPTRHDFGTLDLPGEIALCIVTGDQAAALFGLGVPQPGTGYINIGTGAFLQTPLARLPPHTPLLISLAFADEQAQLYALEGTVNGAGAALTRAIAEEQCDEASVFAQLQQWLERERMPPLFLNGIGGLGSPDWRADAPTRYIGTGNRAARIVAVAESIVFLLQRNLEAMACAATPLRTLWVSGGLSRIDGLCQRLADLSGMSVHRPEEVEATARGLAHLLNPPGVPAARAARSFAPCENAFLKARYEAWRTSLEDALRS